MACLAGDGCLHGRLFASELSLPIGAVLVFAPFFLKGQQRGLEETLLLLQKLSLERNYQEWLARRVRLDIAVFWTLWLGIIAATVCQHMLPDEGAAAETAAVGSSAVWLWESSLSFEVRRVSGAGKAPKEGSPKTWGRIPPPARGALLADAPRAQWRASQTAPPSAAQHLQVTYLSTEPRRSRWCRLRRSSSKFVSPERSVSANLFWATSAFGLQPRSLGPPGVHTQAAGYVFLHLSLAAIFSGAILCLAYLLVFICRSLCVMIDAFCCDVVGSMKLQEVAHVWNLTQAVLRMASSCIDGPLVVLCIVLAASVPLTLLDMGILGANSAPVSILLPGLIITCGVLYALLLASTISEKCARVPALVNAISFGAETYRARQHTVDYITSSAAGFYVFGMRLTTSTVAKFMYIWCIIAVGLLTRWASQEGDAGLEARARRCPCMALHTWRPRRVSSGQYPCPCSSLPRGEWACLSLFFSAQRVQAARKRRGLSLSSYGEATGETGD